MPRTLTIIIVATLVAPFSTLFINPLPGAFAAETHEVEILKGATPLGDKSFSPNPAEISKGDTIRFVNKDTVLHTATSGEGTTATKSNIFDTGFLGPKRSAEVTINQVGEFAYYCEAHPTMVGVVKVSETSKGTTPFKTVAVHDGQDYEIVGTSQSSVEATSATINPGVSVVVRFEGSGEVELTLPASMIEGISSLSDSDGAQIPYSKVDESPSATTVKFTVPEGIDRFVTITGSRVVPEFYALPAVIVVGSLLTAILIANFKISNGSASANTQTGNS